MRRAIEEMDRRRKKQLDYNRKFHITPQTIQKGIREEEEFIDETKQRAYGILRERGYDYLTQEQAPLVLKQLEREMQEAADNLDFELAAILRDKIFELKGVPHRKKLRSGARR
jgi:excinuclease ABC subunit B